MKYVDFTIPAFLLIISSAVVSLAQEDTIRVETNLVTLNVAVTDKKGNYVRGLNKGDFAILDNNLKQDIDTFSTETAPVSVGIVYDMHPTTDEQSASVLEALRRFTGRLDNADDYFVNVFNERGSLSTDFVPNEKQVRDFVVNGEKSTPASLYDAIFAASNRVAAMKNPKKVLLVLTDGADHNSQHSLKELRLHLRSINLPVYSLTFSNEDKRQFGYSELYRTERPQRLGIGESADIDRGMLAEISKTSGGQSFERTIRNRYYLSALCTKVMDEVKNQYVIGFYPETPDGRWHKLRVSVNPRRMTRYKLSARKGYQSPKKR